MAPAEIFREEGEVSEEEIKEMPNTRKTPQERFDDLIKQYYNINPYSYNPALNHELEVRFGTKGVKSLSRNDYDNVIKKLKSSGFNLVGDSNGEYY